MKCNDIHNRLKDFRDGKLSERELNEFCTHLDICATCQALVAADNKISNITESNVENTTNDNEEKGQQNAAFDIEMKRALSHGDYWTPERLTSVGKRFLTGLWIVLVLFLGWVYYECIYSFRTDTENAVGVSTPVVPGPTVTAPKFKVSQPTPSPFVIKMPTPMKCLRQMQDFVDQLNPADGEALPQTLPPKEYPLVLIEFIKKEIDDKNESLPPGLVSTLKFLELSLPTKDKSTDRQIKELSDYARSEKIDEKLIQVVQYLKKQKQIQIK